MSIRKDVMNTNSKDYVTREAVCRGSRCGVKIREHVPKSPDRQPPQRTLCADCLRESFERRR